ncbi:MAG: OadG family protein [Porticoccaceae bacterium]|nr:OadG family protein [Porticoccaceae bacterium]
MQDSKISIISQGLDLMLYGMGTVFFFLVLMVFVLYLLAKTVEKFPGPDTTAKATQPSSLAAQPALAGVDPAHMKAIEQAVRQLSKK